MSLPNKGVIKQTAFFLILAAMCDIVVLSRSQVGHPSVFMELVLKWHSLSVGAEEKNQVSYHLNAREAWPIGSFRVWCERGWL